MLWLYMGKADYNALRSRSQSFYVNSYEDLFYHENYIDIEYGQLWFLFRIKKCESST